MMLNIRSAVRESVLPYFPVGALIGMIFVFQVFFILNDEALPAISTSGDTSMAAMYAGIQQVVHDISAYVYTHGVFRWEVIYASISGVYHTIAQASMIQGHDLNEVPPSAYIQWSEKAQAISNIEALAQVLYTYYFVYFLLASIILLIAMVGGITLTMHKGSPIQKQQIAEQNRRDPSKTVAKIRAQ
jgi:NADH:ubiquinone oxidoreductase subunit 6 (subunit J)